jgi:hypothetical protein
VDATRQETPVIATWRRYQREHPRVLDAALVVLLFADAFAGSMLRHPDTPHTPAVGRLRAGRRPEGGFQVTAGLPLQL